MPWSRTLSFLPIRSTSHSSCEIAPIGTNASARNVSKHGTICLPPAVVYRRGNIEFHDAAYKLEGLAHYFFVTRDAELVRKTRELWQREIDLIVKSRDAKTGLLPREKYCSDIDTPVVSLVANSNCWRGLRDMSLVLKDIGEEEE